MCNFICFNFLILPQAEFIWTSHLSRCSQQGIRCTLKPSFKMIFEFLLKLSAKPSNASRELSSSCCVSLLLRASSCTFTPCRSCPGPGEGWGQVRGKPTLLCAARPALHAWWPRRVYVTAITATVMSTCWTTVEEAMAVLWAACVRTAFSLFLILTAWNGRSPGAGMDIFLLYSAGNKLQTSCLMGVCLGHCFY